MARGSLSDQSGLRARPSRWGRLRFARRHGRRRRTAVLDASDLELAFPGHALESLARTLDPILVIGPVGGKQLHNLIGAVGGHMADRTRCEVDGLTDFEFVFFQRVSPELERYGC